MSLDKIKAEYRKQFYEIYHKNVLPSLVSLEPQRKATLAKVKFIEIILAVIFSLTLIVTLKVVILKEIVICGAFSSVSMILSVILLLSIILVPIHHNSKFINLLKERCMPKLTEMFGEIYWDDTDKISDNELNRSDLFAAFNKRSTDDNFAGKYKDVSFQIAETELIHESGSGKNRRVIQVFKGVVIKFKSNKTIKNKTIIATRGDMNIRRTNGLAMFLAFLPIVINILTMRLSLMAIAIIFAVIALLVIISIKTQKTEEKMHEVKLEDPVFNKKFKVYSSDEIESRYLVTTAFMERFINLNTAFGAKKAKCSFYGDNIMFAITTNKNLFEIGDLFHRLDNHKQITEFFNEISSVLTLVDYFKLDERIGL